ncbi:putative ATP-dependent RNA helicase DEAH12, chloroplastic [Cocos nucifera]|uniref:Putative ATP-dependent RNA helicase DEAH12, chloroplastic n=1 Tax=Cocos nucifera TaxID=13894 RepID=A0A8K0I3H2_COCNU|nr:putative ATP-dependent RNA helicase DEAH12, chloroplastic [Cocos nucifera]
MRRGFYSDRRPGRQPFRQESSFFRHERRLLSPQPQSPWRRWKEPPERRPGLVVLLQCSPPTQKGFSYSYMRELMVSCPFSPRKSSVYSQGSRVAELHFRCWADALEATVYLGGRRLEGSHPLTHSIGLLISQRAEEKSRLRVLFAGHIRDLLECEAVRQYEGKIGQLENEIKKVSEILMKPKRLATFGELQDRRGSLEVEKQRLKSRLKAFRTVMEDLLDCLCKQQQQEEEGKVTIFNLQGELDRTTIHNVKKRECRRLKDGLPIYSCRRKILSHIFSNQDVDIRLRALV